MTETARFIGDVLERLQRCKDEAAVWTQGKRIAADCGSEWLSLGHASRRALDSPVVRSSLPPGVMADYMAKGVPQTDPWMRYSAREPTVCDFDLRAPESAAPMPGMSNVRSLFIDHGAQFMGLYPFAHRAQVSGLVVYATSAEARVALRQTRTRQRLQVLAALLSAMVGPAADQTGNPEHYRISGLLTERERDALRYLASGLQGAGIAYRMGIREVTVAKHLRNARHKLGARTREQCLAIALADGLIHL